MKPIYKHDCVYCVFIANIYLPTQVLDAYVCPSQQDPSVVLRSSSEGPDYWSSPASMIDRITDPTNTVTPSGMGVIAQWVYRKAQEFGHFAPSKAAGPNSQDERLLRTPNADERAAIAWIRKRPQLAAPGLSAIGYWESLELDTRILLMSAWEDAGKPGA